MATIKYWNGSAWELAIVGKQGPAGPTGPTGPAGSASLQRFRFVATGGETSLSGTDANGNTLAYTPGLEEVFLNGAALIRGQDYVATTGSSITSLTALIATDVVEILAWGVFDVANTISNTLIDAKGDILAGSAADTVSRLAVGANDTVLTADSSTATGLKWGTVSAGGMTQLASGNFPTGADTFTLSSISSGYNDLRLVLFNVKAAADIQVAMRFNGDTSSIYYNQFSSVQTANAMTQNKIETQLLTFANENSSHTVIDIFNYTNTSAHKICQINTISAQTATSWVVGLVKGVWRSTSAINSITIFDMNTNNFTGGTYILYGVK